MGPGDARSARHDTPPVGSTAADFAEGPSAAGPGVVVVMRGPGPVGRFFGDE